MIHWLITIAAFKVQFVGFRSNDILLLTLRVAAFVGVELARRIQELLRV